MEERDGEKKGKRSERERREEREEKEGGGDDEDLAGVHSPRVQQCQL